MKAMVLAGYVLVLSGCSAMTPISPQIGVSLMGQHTTTQVKTQGNASLWRLPSGGWVKFNAAGRLIKTGQLATNLQHHTNLSADPLWQAPQTLSLDPWIAQMDWDNTYLGGYTRSSRFASPIPLYDAEGKLQQWYAQEQVTLGKYRWKNEFWWDHASQQLIKSRQRISPQGDWVEWQQDIPKR